MSLGQKVLWKIVSFLISALLYATGFVIYVIPETDPISALVNKVTTLVIFTVATWLLIKIFV